MSDNDLPNVAAPDDHKPVISLTDLIDQLEQRAFTRSLDERHPDHEPSSQAEDSETA